MEQAIAQEDFETAALLRDQLRDMAAKEAEA
jgi:protein-arginine kinase activator protein McsA